MQWSFCSNLKWIRTQSRGNDRNNNFIICKQNRFPLLKSVSDDGEIIWPFYFVLSKWSAIWVTNIFSLLLLKYFCRRGDGWESDGWCWCSALVTEDCCTNCSWGCCRDCRGLQAGTSSMQRLDYRLLTLLQLLTCSPAVPILHNNTKLHRKSNISCPTILTEFFAIRISLRFCAESFNIFWR